jgi:DNA repair exonuclease SbcCD nuclease subunit
MTRVALVGDVHLTLSKNKEFEANRFELLCKTLNTKEYDKVIFMGDLLDRARPSLEELSLLRKGLLSIEAEKIIIDGNHEAVTKDSCTYDYLDIPNVSYKEFEMDYLDDVSVFFMGYKRLKDYLLIPKTFILLSHFRSNFGIIKEEVDTLAISKKAKQVFLGDIHQRHQPIDNVVYTGSPYGIHFSREAHKHGYIELTLDKGTFTYSYVDLELPTKRIINATTDTINECINDKDLFRINVTGNSKELEELPQIGNVQYVTQLILQEAEVTIDTKTDMLESLISIVGESLETRRVLSKVYKEIT